MSETNPTSDTDKINILSDLWMNYRFDPGFEDFMAYNDIALPLSYLLSTSIVQSTPKAMMFIEETWGVLLSALEIEDTGFESLDDMLGV